MIDEAELFEIRNELRALVSRLDALIEDETDSWGNPMVPSLSSIPYVDSWGL